MTDAFPLPPDLRAAFGLSDATLFPLPGDASTRRYARVIHPVYGPSLVLADTPGTPHYDNYLKIGRHLTELGFSTPKIFETAEDQGIALIEDLGDHTYSNLLDTGSADKWALYDLASSTLADLHNAPSAKSIDLPPYDMKRLSDEVALFPDWFAPATGKTLSDNARERHQSLWRDALTPVAWKRDALVLRDYHVDNLVFLEDRADKAAAGLLDFQDGLIGSAAYDLVSLTQDARRDVDSALETYCLGSYLSERPEIDEAAFLAEYHLLGAQRHSKIAGIFHRLNARDRKPAYLVHIPRVLRLLENALEAAHLHDIRDFYDAEIPQWRP